MSEPTTEEEWTVMGSICVPSGQIVAMVPGLAEPTRLEVTPGGTYQIEYRVGADDNPEVRAVEAEEVA